MWETAVAANRAAVGAMNPGATGLEVDTAARTVVEKEGFEAYGYARGGENDS